MILAIIFGYAVSLACIAGVLIAAACGCPWIAIGCGVLAVWTAFGAAHLAGKRAEAREIGEGLCGRPRL